MRFDPLIANKSPLIYKFIHLSECLTTTDVDKDDTHECLPERCGAGSVRPGTVNPLDTPPTHWESPMNILRKYLASSAVCAVTVSLIFAPSLPASATSSEFKHPGAIALDHNGHLWVANADYFGVTEINAHTGQVIRVVSAKADGFIDPTGIAVSGNNVWVVSGSVTYNNGTSNYGMVSELNATTGDLVRTVNLKKYGVTGLSAVSADAPHVWVTADGGEQVAELSNATGRIVRVFRGRQKHVEPGGIYSDGRHVWISSLEIGEGVVERSALTGNKLRTITPTHMTVPPGGGSKVLTYLGPRFVTADARYVWTGNDEGTRFKPSGGSVTQINAVTGTIVRTIDTATGRFYGGFQSIVSDGNRVWVVNGSVYYQKGRRGDSVTELNATNGSFVRVVVLHDGIYSDPVGLATNGVDVWVTDQGGGALGIGSVIELNASTGAVVRMIRG